jgi:hypothetical protein
MMISLPSNQQIHIVEELKMEVKEEYQIHQGHTWAQNLFSGSLQSQADKLKWVSTM